MASVKVKFRASSVADREGRLYYQIIHNRVTRQINSGQTKHKVSEILHLLGNDNTRLTALVDNMLRFVIGIYRDELNYLHEKKNDGRPF